MSQIIIAILTFLLTNSAFAEVRQADLPAGYTAYEFAESQSGPVVVLIHGVSGPMNVWDETYSALKGRGYQVLRYDLYGRGKSERIDADYDQALFRKQLEGLLEHLEIGNKPVHSIASSMGNIIASEYAIKHPKEILSLTMVGPAGFPMAENISTRLSKLPFIGEALTCIIGHNIMMERNKEYFYRPERFKGFIDDYEEQLRISGSKLAILSTMRHMPVKDYVVGYKELSRLAIPTLIVWGRQDVSFDFKFSKDLTSIMSNAKFVAIDEAGHLPQLEQAQKVSPIIIDFLERQGHS